MVWYFQVVNQALGIKMNAPVLHSLNNPALGCSVIDFKGEVMLLLTCIREEEVA